MFNPRPVVPTRPNTSALLHVLHVTVTWHCHIALNNIDSLLCKLLSATNKMQRYAISFIIVNALHVSGGPSAHHQELKKCTHSIWYLPDCNLLLLPLGWLGWNSPTTLAVAVAAESPQQFCQLFIKKCRRSPVLSAQLKVCEFWQVLRASVCAAIAAESVTLRGTEWRT
jgi:hypothetical protein